MLQSAQSRRAAYPHAEVEAALQAGSKYLFQLQEDDFHWCQELESNPTVTAEYVFLCQALGRNLDRERAPLTSWLLGQQKADGSYGMAFNCPGDVSTTAEVYLALKILGADPQQEHMLRARAFVLEKGGMAQVRIFTRIFFAMFGLFDWRDVPALPAELIFMPPSCPVNIYSMASWARGTIVPLLIMGHHKPIYDLPQPADRSFTHELWLQGRPTRVPYLPTWKALFKEHGLSWTTFFSISDVLLKAYDKVHNKRLRQAALRRCAAWVLERQEAHGDWAGIFPPMLNNLLALPLQGYGVDSEPMRLGLEAMERFAWEDARGRRIQACVSPVWDSLLSLIGLRDACVDGADPRLQGAADWIAARQITERRGDWAVYRPGLAPGGWSFEYSNNWYPDVDDTAAVLLALLKQDPKRASSPTVLRAVEWILGMQNRDGGWGAFDADNDKTFLNDAPMTDMRALCDPSTADVTGRIVEALGLLAQTPDCVPAPLLARMRQACQVAVRLLGSMQETTGAWFGRWGVNYIYGTSNVLCGLSRVPDLASPLVCGRAVAWLRRVQNLDGGWGEGLDSYTDAARAAQGPSTASQTAWALMGLLAWAPATDQAIEKGVAWLVRNQAIDSTGTGTWIEPETTATGFPGHFYVRYDLYRHYFPMMALGRYAQAHGLKNLQVG